MSANQPPEALDIVWPRLIAIADEMATTMFRTAFSHDVVEVHDMSTGLYDDRGCLIGQTWLGATGHTGVMPVYGQNLLRYFPPETVRPGDVFICNDPWICNGQTADVFITTPAFHDRRLIGFSINSVHHVDIGGRKGSGLSEEVYEEGLIIPPLKLYDDGEPNEQLFAILRRNVRFAEKMIGDLRAQVAAGWAGSRELERLAAEFGLERFRAHADEIMRRTEAGMREGIAALPDGEYHEELQMEIDGIAEPQTLAVTVRIEGSDVYCRFHRHLAAGAPSRELSHQLHARLRGAAAEARVRPHPAEQSGDLRAAAPVGARGHAAQSDVSGGVLLAAFGGDAGLGADVPGAGAHRAGPGAGGFGLDADVAVLRQRGAAERRGVRAAPARVRRDGRPAGRRRARLGELSLQRARRLHRVVGDGDAGAVRGARADSGLGRSGEFRGGLGQELVFSAYRGQVKEGEPLVLSGSAGRMRFPPRGLLGGGDGSYGAIEVNGEAIAPSSSPNVTFGEGDVVRLRLPGGGGHGDPARRRRERVEADLKAGYVTSEGARRDYGYG